MRCWNAFGCRIGTPRLEFASDYGLYNKFKRDGALSLKCFAQSKTGIAASIGGLTHHLAKPRLLHPVP